MKKIILHFILVIAVCSSALTQPLQNTTWNVYDLSNNFSLRFAFGTDTGFISYDLNIYNPLTHFVENGNAITFNDIPVLSMACPSADTGQYTFAIHNDTLSFTLVSDPCTSRNLVLTTYHWVRTTTGIESHNATEAIHVLPNPSFDGIFNLKINESGFDKFSICTLEGKLIQETIISDRGAIECTLNLSDFPSGIYLLTLKGNQENKVFKLMR
jgi:hypothetical protein